MHGQKRKIMIDKWPSRSSMAYNQSKMLETGFDPLAGFDPSALPLSRVAGREKRCLVDLTGD